MMPDIIYFISLHFTPMAIKSFVEANGFKVRFVGDGKVPNVGILKTRNVFRRSTLLSFLWSSTMLIVAQKSEG